MKRWLGIALSLALSACAADQTEMEEDLELGVREDALTLQNPQTNGSFSACYTTSSISRSGYSNARLYYPCSGGAIASGTFAATTLSPGYTNSASTIFWLAEHV
ncbi:MAG TPA: hypothetical protein VFZ61_27420, partial [Polyangiales bacterium]